MWNAEAHHCYHPAKTEVGRERTWRQEGQLGLTYDWLVFSDRFVQAGGQSELITNADLNWNLSVPVAAKSGSGKQVSRSPRRLSTSLLLNNLGLPDHPRPIAAAGEGGDGGG